MGSGFNYNYSKSKTGSGYSYNAHKMDEGTHPYLKNALHALGGSVLGAAQGLSDIGANIAQSPSDIYSWATGNQGYKAPRPNLREFTPNSPAGRGGEAVGEFAAPFMSPVMAAEMAGGKAIYGGRMLPRLIANMLGGAAEADPEHRGAGAAVGAAAPAIGGAARAFMKTPMIESTAVRKLNKASELGAKSEPLNIPIDSKWYKSLQYQMKSTHLKPSKVQLNNLLGNAAQGDFESYRKLSSAMGDIGRELLHPAKQSGEGFGGFLKNLLSSPQSSAAERLTGQQLNELRQQYIANTLKHLEKKGHGKLASLEKGGREDYRRYKEFLPLRNKLLMGAGAAVGIPGLNYLRELL